MPPLEFNKDTVGIEATFIDSDDNNINPNQDSEKVSNMEYLDDIDNDHNEHNDATPLKK